MAVGYIDANRAGVRLLYYYHCGTQFSYGVGPEVGSHDRSFVCIRSGICAGLVGRIERRPASRDPARAHHRKMFRVNTGDVGYAHKQKNKENSGHRKLNRCLAR